jgi:WD repeat-containing protein 23
MMSYRGHSVMQTLIRAYFSPADTTGQRFIYAGSADGVVHVWGVAHSFAGALPALPPMLYDLKFPSKHERIQRDPPHAQKDCSCSAYLQHITRVTAV